MVSNGRPTGHASEKNSGLIGERAPFDHSVFFVRGTSHWLNHMYTSTASGPRSSTDSVPMNSTLPVNTEAALAGIIPRAVRRRDIIGRLIF